MNDNHQDPCEYLTPDDDGAGERKETPIERDAKELADIFVKDGRPAAEARYQEIQKAEDLKVWEASALSDEFRKELESRGIDPFNQKG